jgi:hypothetical protein
MMRNETRKLLFPVITVLFLLLSGCGKGNASKPEAKSTSKVAGSLTINGKEEPLTQVYARRLDAKLDENEAAIDVLLTNQAVDDAMLARVFGEMEKDSYYQNAEILKGSSLRGLHLRIPKNSDYKSWGQGKVGFYDTLLTPEGFSRTGITYRFQEFDLRKGNLKGKIEKEWEVTSVDRDFKERKDLCHYSLSFEVSLGESGGRAANSDDATSSLPEEGMATGTLISKDGATALKYAYAWKKRVFFDESDAETVILVTDKPIPKAAMAEIVREVEQLDDQGLQGLAFLVDTFGRLYAGYAITKDEFLSTTLFKNVAYAVENGRAKGRVDYDKDPDSKIEFSLKDFSVTFDAPLKSEPVQLP